MLITSFIFDSLLLKDFVVFAINKYPFIARRLLASAIQSGQFLPIMESETIRVGLNNFNGINDLSPNKPKNSSSRMELTLTPPSYCTDPNCRFCYALRMSSINKLIVVFDFAQRGLGKSIPFNET